MRVKPSPITYGHELLVDRIEGGGGEIRHHRELRVKPVLVGVKRGQLGCFRHLIRKSLV